MLLPSEQEWLSRSVEYLLDGDLIVVRGLPRTGKTFLANALVQELPETAILVSGREFTEKNQGVKAETLIADLEERTKSFGLAQLVFDDYGAALRRSLGGKLQALLYSLLVDSEHSRDIGAILLSRWQDPIHIRRRGSPLVSRARFVPLPSFSEKDLIHHGVPTPNSGGVQYSIGHLTSFLARTHVIGSRLVTSPLEQSIRSDVPHAAGALGPCRRGPAGALPARLARQACRGIRRERAHRENASPGA